MLSIDRLSWKLGISVALLVAAAISGVVFLSYRIYTDGLVKSSRRGAQRETRLIRLALEHQMLSKDDELIARMVAGFASRDHVRRVMILDRKGEVRYSSDPKIRRRHFDRRSRTCQVCHQDPAEKRASSKLIALPGGAVLRCVQPIFNRTACHSCHESKHRINGVIIVDVPIGRSRKAMLSSMRFLGFGAGGLALALLVGIGLTFRRIVLRRLHRFESRARALAQGDVKKPIPVEGRDAIARVERQFNSMAESVSGLLDQLGEQRASLDKVMNSVDDGMVVLDRERRIVAANDAFLRRFPVPAPKLLGHTCCDINSIGSLTCRCGEGECPTLRCFDSGSVQMAVRSRQLADGSTRQEEVRSSPVCTDSGHISHVVEVWRDISDRRSAEARFADYQRMVSLGMLASGFSHELNTPLGSIGTCLDGVWHTIDGGSKEQGGIDAEEIAEYVRIARSQVQRCGDITEQFLQLARGKTLTREIVDLSSLVEVTARLCRVAAREASVKVATEAGDPCSVLANTAAVQQVLLNLLLNAIEASDAGTTIHLSCSASDGGGAVISVRDEGRGMTPEELHHVFEPFYTRRGRANGESGDKKREGTGLGLFVSMSLARGWGGDIAVSSELGEGTTFRVTFPPPAARDDDAPEQAA